MQKALVVRNAVEDAAGHSWSYEVDPAGRSAEYPLGRLLVQGWRVVHTCPMPSELDSCCLVIVESPAESTCGGGGPPVRPAGADCTLAQLEVPCDPASAWSTGGQATSGTPRAPSWPRRHWDGETIPLDVFGVTPSAEERN